MAAPFDKSGIIEFFLMEAGEHIQNLNKGLLSLEKDPKNSSIIDELFRAAHTLKGSAAMMGFQGVSDVAHKAEDMLGQFRAGSVPIRKDTLNFLFDSVDAINILVDGVSSNKPEDPLLVESLSQAYKDVVDNLQKAAAPAPQPEKNGPAEAKESGAPPAAPAASSAPPPKKQRDELDEAWEKSFAPSPPGGKSATPAPTVKTASPAPPKKKKDEVDEAWERTFDIGIGAPSLPSEGEKLPVSPAVKQGGPGSTAQRFGKSPLDEERHPFASTGEQTAYPAAPAQPSDEVSAGVAAEAASLRDENEAAKRVRTAERRGVGRRAADAIDVEKQFIRVNIERLDNLMNLVGEMIVNRNRLARQVDFIKSLREELAFSQGRLLHEIKKFEEKYEYTMNFETPGPQQAAADHHQDFFELEFDRYDDFNLLSRKLTEITNDTNEIMTELAGFFDSFELDTARISTITTNLQDEITMARMVEMDKLYQMFQRPVRDLAQVENKKVNMVVKGGETKIDKTIFEIISDPLMHMIRNSISHGIEPVDLRKKAGKEPVGTILLNARHEGNNIVIEIEDDGRGMDPVVLRKAAADKGFMTAAEAQVLSDTEVLNLIFRPGFSTAESVGKVSGRGVGMDVVATHLAKINGRIEIKTEKGVGTKFVIRLPLTLAIAQALIIKFKDQELAVPMTLVEETTRFSEKDIQRAAGEEMVNLRGALVRLHRLNDVLGVGKFPKKEETYRYPTLILGMAEKRLALMVEDISGREEIVVKSLGDYLRSVKLFSGATISGEGNVRLIINVATLFGDEAAVTTKATIVSSQEAAPEISRRKPRILVVDDSISIRKYVQRFLDRMGYDVEVAPDGMEALNIMGKSKFDAVISDLEMPVMHGYDLMAEMKRNPALVNIPVIVLTSRAGDKHRQKAIEMGAQDYLVKPFEEQEMLGVLKKVLSSAVLAGRG
jgi:chemosensory pili system protein ChpA (sensor histidine kinase/response regulator)